MTITLGRITEKENPTFDEIKKTPLTLFFMRVRDDDGNLNNI